jgi:K+-dependent Na+/Ca+ exchanger-like protein
MFLVIIYGIGIIFSFVILARITNVYFITSLDILARKLKMSSDMAGATLMAIGSSAPELTIAIIAVLMPGEHAEIGLGTIVGSAIFNILVIIGIVAIIKKAFLLWQPVARDLLFYFITLIILFLVFENGQINLYESLALIGLYIAYIIFIYTYKKILKYKDIEDFDVEIELMSNRFHKFRFIFLPFFLIIDKLFSISKNYLFIFLTSILLISGFSLFLVESTIEISRIIRVPELFIAITVLAIGSSVPDLLSSAIVAKQGRGEMAISNAIGSNVFDILIGIGFPSFIFFFIYKSNIIVDKQNLFPSIIFLFGSIILIFIVLIINKWKIGFKAGIFFLLAYLFYLIWEIKIVWN